MLEEKCRRALEYYYENREIVNKKRRDKYERLKRAAKSGN